MRGIDASSYIVSIDQSKSMNRYTPRKYMASLN